MGRVCRCGYDEAATSFFHIDIPELYGFSFCNRCGTVYGPGDKVDEAATARFAELGRPGFTGGGLELDPNEHWGEEQSDSAPDRPRWSTHSPSEPPW